MKKIFLSLILLLVVQSVFSQERRVVVKTHADGSPHIVYYLSGKGDKAVKVREEGFYPNGKMEYSGQVKNNIEHGEWKYYYDDGTLKAVEYWKNGVEDGTWKEYHPDGKLAREIIYKNGKVLQTIVK